MGLVKTRKLAAMRKQQRVTTGVRLNGLGLLWGLGSRRDFLVAGDADA